MTRKPDLVVVLAGVALACSFGLLATVAPVVAVAIACAVVLIGAVGFCGVRGILAAALLATWFGRAAPVIGFPSIALSYADLALVPLGAMLAWVEASRRGLANPRGRAPLAFLLLALSVCAFATNTGPVRAAVGALLLIEPFLLVFALTHTRDNSTRERVMVGALIVAMVTQFPFVLYQWQTMGAGDQVQGTLIGAGAGAHVLGGGGLMATLAYVALRRRRLLKVAAALAAGMALIWVTDAKQVIPMVPLALAVIYLKRRGLPSVGRLAGAVLVAGLLAAPAYLALSQTYAVRALQATAESGGGKIAVARAVSGDLLDSPGIALFGFGAGNTVSRLSQLTSATGSREGSPTSAIGLEPSTRAAYYDHASRVSGYVGETSAAAAQTSLLGIAGDYGLVGLAAYLGLLLSVARRLWFSSHPLSAAALAGWVIALPLSLIADWLEQPPFMLIVAAITGVALAGEKTEPADHLPKRNGPAASQFRWDPSGYVSHASARFVDDG